MEEEQVLTPDESSFEEQDLRILKNVLSNVHQAVDFAQSYDEKLFMGDAVKVARPILAYIKNYKAIPTRRILEDRFQNDWEMARLLDTFYYNLDQIEVEPTEYKYDLDKIKDRFKEAKITSIKEYAQISNPSSFIQYLRNNLQEIQKLEGKKKLFQSLSVKDFLSDFKQSYNEKSKNKDLGKGILTGYSFIDYCTNGLSPADFLIIGGSTGAGKSMLLNNMAVQMWMQSNTLDNLELFQKGYNVLYFSLEMPYEACFRRTVARIADVPMMSLRDASLNKQQFAGVNKAFNFIEKYPYQFQIVDIPRGANVDQLEEIYNQVRETFIPDVVVVDYLGLLESNSFDGDDWLKLGKIAGELHEFARMYNFALLSAVQLNRPQKSNKDSADEIGIHRIGRSSLIMHHATCGIQIETRKDETTYSDLKYHIIKCRDGELGHHYLIKNFKHASLKDPAEPFQPTDAIIPLENNLEDISELLEKHQWNQDILPSDEPESES